MRHEAQKTHDLSHPQHLTKMIRREAVSRAFRAKTHKEELQNFTAQGYVEKWAQNTSQQFHDAQLSMVVHLMFAAELLKATVVSSKLELVQLNAESLFGAGEHVSRSGPMHELCTHADSPCL